MKNDSKIILIKTVHTLIWLFFNIVIFYMFYAAVTNQLGFWLWAGFALIFLEGVVLLMSKSYCPLTLIARQYSDSTKENFDIYLPVWLARYNKMIYMLIMVIIILITLYQLANSGAV